MLKEIEKINKKSGILPPNLAVADFLNITGILTVAIASLIYQAY
jgi:hypothetical protein